MNVNNIAKAIRMAVEGTNTRLQRDRMIKQAAMVGIETVALELAKHLAATHHNFDYQNFRRQCGLEVEGGGNRQDFSASVGRKSEVG